MIEAAYCSVLFASLLVVWYYRKQSHVLRRSIATTFDEDDRLLLSHGEALQRMMLVKHRLRVEYDHHGLKIPVPPEIPDDIVFTKLSPGEGLSQYFQHIVDTLSQDLGVRVCIFLKQGDAVQGFYATGTEPLFKAVLHQNIHFSQKVYVHTSSCLGRFGITESLCLFEEYDSSISAALWLGVDNKHISSVLDFKAWDEFLLSVLGKYREKMIEQSLEPLRSSDRLLTHISHDIRSPLNNIRSILHLFQLEGIKEDSQQLLGVALKNCDVMSEMVETILDYSAQQNHRVCANPESVCAAKIIQEVIETFSLTAKLKSLTIVEKLDPSLYIYVDRRHFRRIISNLLSNAIKYTISGQILITCKRTDDVSSYVSIEDTGIGLTELQISKLFEPFSRFHVSVAEGAGLGLAVTKSLIEANGGSISVQSQYGKGTTFSIVLPSAASLFAPQIKRGNSLEQCQSVLIADDDKDFVLSLSRCIAQTGYEVLTASSAVEAIGILRVTAVGAVIFDKNMPGGGEVLVDYLSKQDTPPFSMMVTGEFFGFTEALPECCEFRMKPIRPRDVLEWLESKMPPEMRAVA